MSPARGPSRLEHLFATKEIVVCCGSGGVGKTSVAAAAALGAATRLGGKTLVLTIDPARRSRMPGRTCLAHSQAPLRSTANTASHSASVIVAASK